MREQVSDVSGTVEPYESEADRATRDMMSVVDTEIRRLRTAVDDDVSRASKSAQGAIDAANLFDEGVVVLTDTQIDDMFGEVWT